jgi:DNA-binding GntR family transcriptional regulator
MPTTQQRFDEYRRLMDDVLRPLMNDSHVGEEERKRLLATPVTLPDGRRTVVRALTAEDFEAIRDYMYTHAARLTAELFVQPN